MSSIFQLVINVEENIQSVHYAGLSRRWPAEIQRVGISNSFIFPSRLSWPPRLTAFVPWTNLPVENMGIDNVTDRLDYSVEFLNNSSELCEFSRDFGY